MANRYGLSTEDIERIKKHKERSDKRAAVRAEWEKAEAREAFAESERNSEDARRRELLNEAMRKAAVEEHFYSVVTDKRTPSATPAVTSPSTGKLNKTNAGTVIAANAVGAKLAPSAPATSPQKTKSDYETLLKLQGVYGGMPPVPATYELAHKLLGVSEDEFDELVAKFNSDFDEIAAEAIAKGIISDQAQAFHDKMSRQILNPVKSAPSFDTRIDYTDQIYDPAKLKEFTGIDFSGIDIGDFILDKVAFDTEAEEAHRIADRAAREAIGATPDQKLGMTRDYIEAYAMNDPYAYSSAFPNVKPANTVSVGGAQHIYDVVDETGLIGGYRNTDYYYAGVDRGSMTDEQKYIYSYWKQKDPYTAQSYLTMIIPEIRQESANKVAKMIQDIGEEYPVIGALISVGMSAADLALSPAKLVTNLASLHPDIEYNPAFAVNLVADARHNLRSGALSTIDNDTLRGAANIALSISDELITGKAAAGLGSATFKTVSNAASSANSAADTARAAGASEGQVLGLMLASAAFEYFFGRGADKQLVDNLSGMGVAEAAKHIEKKVLPELLKNLVKSGVGEFKEESLTALSQNLAEAIILGDGSSLAAAVEKYREKGLNEETASLAAFWETFVIEPASEGAVGALSGVAHAGLGDLGNIGLIRAVSKYNKAARESDNPNVESFADRFKLGGKAETDWDGQAAHNAADIVEALLGIGQKVTPVAPDTKVSDNILNDPTYERMLSELEENEGDEFGAGDYMTEQMPVVPEMREPERVIEKAGDIPVTTEYDGIPVIPEPDFVPEPVAEMRKTETEAIEPEALPTPETEAESRVPTVEDIKSDAEAGSVTEELMSDEELQKILADFDALKPDDDSAVEPENELERELMSDEEFNSTLEELRKEEPPASNFTPSDGVVEARDPNAEYFETGTLKPLTAEQEMRRIEAQNAKNDIERTGILAGAKKSEIRLAEAMAKATGRNIIFMSDDIRVNGKFEDGTIYVNTTRGETVFSQIVAHELTHSVESSKGYGSLVNAVKAFVESGGYKDADGNALTFEDIMIEAHAEQDDFYKERLGKTYTDTQAKAEAVAKVLERMFSETSAEAKSGQVALDAWLAANVANNKNAFTRMWYALSKMAKRLRSDIRDRRARGREGYDADAREAELMLRKIEDIRDRFARALVQAKKKPNKGAAYSVSPTLNSDLDKVLNGTFNAEKGEVYLGETSNFMTDVIGAESLKVTMPASKAYSAMVTLEEYKKKPLYTKQDHYHGIGKEDFIEILEKSENPVAAFAAAPDEDGNSRYNRIVLVTDKKITDVKTGEEGYAVVVEEVDTNGMLDGKRVSVNKAITVYPRAQIEADISRAIADGRILDIKTKDQFSAGVRGSNPQAAIRKTDLANNIAHFWANVKWENSKNKIFSADAPKGMTAMQAKLMEAGLIDADGKVIDLTESEETNGQTNFSVSGDTDFIGYRAVNDMEEQNRERALELYRMHEEGRDIGLEEGQDVGEYIFTLTGWGYDNSGRLIVDHEYAANNGIDDNSIWLNKWAHIVDAENRDLRSENEGLREQLREAQGKKSSDYTSSKKAAAQIIEEVADTLGGGFSKAQKAKLVKRYLEIYDEATEFDGMGRPVVSAEKIAERLGELVADMQDVRLEDAEAFELAKQIRAELKAPVFLSETARGDFADGYGKVAKQYRGKVNFASKERGTAVDVRYMELSSMFPDWFPENIDNEADQAKRMLEVADELTAEWGTLDRYEFSGGESVRRSDANKTIKRLLEGIGEIYSIPKTAVDKYASYSEKVKRDADRRFEKERERIEANADKRVDQIAATYSEATDQMAAEYRDAQKKMQEQAQRAYWKGMTARLFKRLDKLVNRPTKERNVKAGMKDLVQSALDLINSIYNDKIPARDIIDLDYSYATEAERRNLDELRRLYEMRDGMDEGADTEGIDGEIKNYESRLRELFDRKRSQMKEATVTSAIGDLYAKYGELENSTDDYIRDAYDETTNDILASIVSDADLKGKKLRDLTPAELEKVYGALAAVTHAVYKANNLFGAQKAMAADAARTAVKDELYEGKAIKHDGKLPNAFREYTNNLMRPDVFFEFLGSETLSKIAAESMRNGEIIYAADVYAAQGRFAELKEKYHSDKWKTKKKREFHTEDGRKFEMSFDEILSFYALWLRGKQAQDHIINGGIVLNSDGEKLFERVNEELNQKPKKGEKAKDAAEVIDKVTRSSGKAIRISDVLANKIIESLTDDQRGFVREGIKYLSEVMGAKGNEVFRELHGIDWFGEDIYFPIESDKNYLTRRIDEQNPNAAKLTSPSFVKNTVDEAKNPLIICNFADVWARHVHDMSMYHAFAIPMANFNKVYGYARAGDAARGTENTSIRADIEKLRGKAAIDYINDYISDINGGVHSDPRGGLWEKGLGNWKKVKVASSLSVIIQQPMSIIRAMGYLNAGTLTKRAVLRKPGRIRKQWREMMQYSGVTVLKDMGGFDMHSSRSATDYIKDSKTVMQKADDIWMAGATVADKWAWCVMWNAAKDKAAKEMKKNGGFVKNSEAHLKRTAEIFDEVIYKTQVYDSIFAKSAFLRSSNPVVKMSMAFMGEPTTTFNMILDGYYDMRHGNKARGARKIVSAFASQIFAAAASSVIYAMRDDDEDETFLEKYVEHFLGGLVDNVNPAGYLPWVKDVWSIFQGYDAKRNDMGLIEDLSRVVQKIAQNGSGVETVTDLAMVVGDIFGIPASNIKREVMAAFNAAQMWARDIETTDRGIAKAAEKGFWDSIPVVSYVRDKDSKSDELYKSILGGETDHVERLKSGYKDDASYEAAVKTGLRENDERITDAAKLLLEGDVEGANKIVRIIAREGYFDKELVGGAVDAAYKAFENGIGNAASSFAEGDIDAATDYAEQLAEAGYDRELISDRINAAVEELVNETPEDEDEAYTYYRASHIGTAFEHGHEDQIPAIVDELISVKIENDDSGDDPKDVEREARSTVKGGVTRYLKPIYIEAYASGDTETMARVLNTLLATGLYGKSEGTVQRETLRSWEDAYEDELKKKAKKGGADDGIPVVHDDIPKFVF